MKIGILGSGIVGKTLANGFLKNGHEVMIGTRELSMLQEWKTKVGDKGHLGNFEETAGFINNSWMHAFKLLKK